MALVDFPSGPKWVYVHSAGSKAISVRLDGSKKVPLPRTRVQRVRKPTEAERMAAHKSTLGGRPVKKLNWFV